ncbi:hypothetical protein AB4Y86_00750 [Arthrobacter sp. 2YAF22_2]|uniref:SRPBCC family protein n=1 Tax=Arthrobacter sp. 2YAF22_2 TaxID=3233029 RepID=UPI003F8E67E0
MSLTTRGTTHRLAIDAPEDLVFSVLRDTSHWPLLDGLTVYSERVSGEDLDHELRISVVTNGALSSCHCRRFLDPAGLRILFEQSAPEAPLLRLAGGWAVSAGADDDQGLAVVTLSHEYEVEDGAAELSSWIHRSIDDYGQRELAALKLSSERLGSLLQQHSGTKGVDLADGRPVHD